MKQKRGKYEMIDGVKGERDLGERSGFSQMSNSVKTGQRNCRVKITVRADKEIRDSGN